MTIVFRERSDGAPGASAVHVNGTPARLRDSASSSFVVHQLSTVDGYVPRVQPHEVDGHSGELADDRQINGHAPHSERDVLLLRAEIARLQHRTARLRDELIEREAAIADAMARETDLTREALAEMERRHRETLAAIRTDATTPAQRIIAAAEGEDE